YRNTYLNEAIKIYSWEKNYLFDRETGAVFDHINKGGHIQKNWIFTYNQGTFLGAAHELYKITGDKQYLEDAIKASNFVIDQLSDNKGVLSDATGGDGGLFHGIFFRYFVKLINEPDLDAANRKKFHDYITNCATVLVENGLKKNTHLYAGKWWEAASDKEPVGLTSHLTGCMLIEAMCVLKPLN
ncbi:MAG: alpha-1,6-mannanase, partial [Bacteroidales bacterium]|nr:alpha-1,6-mannanase [Bacteroidales bacterium]